MRVCGHVADFGERGGATWLAVRVQEVRWEENDARGIVLIQALAKGGRDEMALEAATGLGVEVVQPWAAARSVARWPGGRAERSRQRWEAIARAEVKVARRAWVPRIAPLATTAQLIQDMEHGELAGVEIWVLHEDAELSFVEQIRSGQGRPDRPTGLVVGPEGGITPEELTAFADAGGRIVRLGSAVLRASGAAPAALAALAALRGVWG
jgi:16S rRNA (uracil1498-N3)-methyltransferase